MLSRSSGHTACNGCSAEDALIMAPSLGRRFSGINATMEALIPPMRKSLPIACCGTHLSDRLPRTTLWRWLNSRRRNDWRIWHARRNNDMLVGLFLRHVLRQKLVLLFTSAAQRDHSWLTKFCYRRMDAVIATTDKAAAFLQRDATVSHHGVDTQTFRPSVDDAKTVRHSLGLSGGRTLGVFGRIRPQKGTGDLVEALVRVLGRHGDWRVVFVGAVTDAHRAYHDELQRRLRAAGVADRVRFHGYLENFEELPRWYRAVDVVACVSRVEGFGLTCLEGMASGKPVLATRAGAWDEIVAVGQTGWLAETGNPQDLAIRLDHVFATSPDQLRQMGQAARQAVLDRFTIDHEVTRIREVYEQLLRSRGVSLPTITDPHAELGSRAA